MNKEKRTDSDGNIYFIFRYRDAQGKRRVVSKEEYGGSHLYDENVADGWLLSLEKKFEGHKRKDYTNFATKNFNKYYASFEEIKKRKSPAAYKNQMSKLRNFIFKFFIDRHQLYTIQQWPEFLDEFVIWMESVNSKRSDGVVSVSTINDTITVLNQFIEHVVKKHNIRMPWYKLDRLENDSKITADDIPTEDEFNAINWRLSKVSQVFADFHFFLRHTGMRFNEAYGVHIGMVDLEPEFTQQESICFNQSKKTPLMVINLNSQPTNLKRVSVSTSSDHRGKIKRKPLKKKRTLEEGRRVYVFNKRLDKIIRKYGKIASKKHDQELYGDQLEDYGLFFDEIVVQNFRQAYVEAHTQEGIPYKSPHKLRHRCATDLYMKLSDEAIVRQMMGHSANAATVYNHIIEEMALKSKKKGKPKF